MDSSGWLDIYLIFVLFFNICFFWLSQTSVSVLIQYQETFTKHLLRMCFIFGTQNAKMHLWFLGHMYIVGEITMIRVSTILCEITTSKNVPEREIDRNWLILGK